MNSLYIVFIVLSLVLIIGVVLYLVFESIIAELAFVDIIISFLKPIVVFLSYLSRVFYPFKVVLRALRFIFKLRR